ncbi:bifunctional salicylyl-CoA 5-hydroxylase/oxidoreductase [Elioraea thermophila]|uniref:bifunctional salicylyl-CoA 5-hydroxylase/oxidoreductase n=1 Tax=Elioraea thermophila TaxID=2185104 RepID=UPI000DF26345|nr:bifunctional salicylyl-CoA 5-hydroxylase/oxidoreductase [Elioraea thermophila]
MRVRIIGGGPAGLYFAILFKRDWPNADVLVVERNAPDDTFGFGVVFSDQTLETIEDADPETFAAIAQEFAWWDDIAIHFKGEVFRIGGNGFCGLSRVRLLQILQQRARRLGVRLEFRREASPEDFPDADLIVASDGINSAVRTRFADHFEPEVDLRPNRFAWMGSTRSLDAFHFFFRETEYGIFIAHCYQYEANASTWVLETDPETFARAGLAESDEAESARFLEGVFAFELAGHRLRTNRSIWRRFPMIRCARWVKDNVVLLGDAKASAHFSIGSGTKLAMEDAIALHRAFAAGGGVAAALARFEETRREEVEKTQHAADVSLVWFEHVRRFWGFRPIQFAFGLMTRSKAITYDNLELRAPDFVRRVREDFGRAAGGDPSLPPAFQPFRLRGLTLANRLVVSPMCQYSAVDGVPGDWHLVHYGARGMGGAGLLFTEMTCVAPDARITPGCTGLWNDAQVAAWRRIVAFVHANGTAKVALQLGHAGRKGATRLMWEGMDRPLPEGGWPIIAPSPLPYYPDSQVPREMTRDDMERVRDQFVAATRRAIECGFDLLELHCAHGYLLASFLSPLTNRRRDEYGGPIENRARFPLEVFRAMRAVWPEEKPMSVRISATDWVEGGISDHDVIAIARLFAEAGCDLIDVSTGQTVPEARPKYGRMFQVPWADMIRNEVGLATMCVGSITSVDQANTILGAGRADLVAFGRPHLAEPSFVLRGAAQYGLILDGPVQYAPGREALVRSLAREMEEIRELRRRAKPKPRGRGLVLPRTAPEAAE